MSPEIGEARRGRLDKRALPASAREKIGADCAGASRGGEAHARAGRKNRGRHRRQPRDRRGDGRAPGLSGAVVIAAARSLGDETDPRPDTLAYTVAQIRGRGGEAHPYRLDVADAASREAFMTEVLARFGRVDVLVNNAGIAGYGARTWEMPEKHFRRVFEIDLFGARDLIVRAVPGMIERGWGRIVNVSSTIADRAAPSADGPPYLDFHRNSGVAAYAAAKSALNLFTRSLAAELHGTGVSANTVAPVNSVITRASQKAIEDGILSRDRFKAPEDPEVMAEAILALCLVDPDKETGLTTYSGQHLQKIGRPVRGRDGQPFDAKITVESVKY